MPWGAQRSIPFAPSRTLPSRPVSSILLKMSILWETRCSMGLCLDISCLGFSNVFTHICGESSPNPPFACNPRAFQTCACVELSVHHTDEIGVLLCLKSPTLQLPEGFMSVQDY